MTIVSKRELVNFFFTLRGLHMFLRNDMPQYNLEDHFEKHVFLHLIAIKICFNLYDEVMEEGLNYLDEREISNSNDLQTVYFVAFACSKMGKHSLALFLLEAVTQHPIYSEQLENFQVQVQFSQLSTKSLLRKFKSVHAETECILNSNQFDEKLGFYHLNGFTSIILKQYHKALRSFRNVLKTPKVKQIAVRLFEDSHAEVLLMVSICLLYIGRPKQALDRLFEVLQSYDQHTLTVFILVMCNELISRCYRVMGFEFQADRYEALKNEKLSGKPWAAKCRLYDLLD